MARILIMDDDVSIRNALRLTLESFGYEVAEAPDGKEGLRLQRANPADLVVLDILMPEKEGIEVIMDLRRDFPHTKIIAMSGGGQVEAKFYLETAKKLRADSVLEKPFDLNEFIALVKEALGES
jgi:DNA-binding response OmpR family regulator